MTHPLVSQLREIVQSERLNYRALAAKAGISHSLYPKWTEVVPRLDTFEAMAQAAGYELKLVRRRGPMIAGKPLPKLLALKPDVLALRKEGLKLEAIAAELQCSLWVVKRILRNHSCRTNAPQPSPTPAAPATPAL